MLSRFPRRWGWMLGVILSVSACASSPPTTAPPVISDWSVYRGDDARDGRAAGATLTPEAAGRLAPAWRAHLAGAVDGSAIVSGGGIYVASEGGDVAELDAATGAQRWRRSGVGAVAGSPAVDAHAVYVATLTGRLLALSRSDGSTLWAWSAPGRMPALWSSPVLFGDLIVIGVASQAGDQPLESGRLVALRAGNPAWELCTRAGCAAGGGVWSTPAIDAVGRAFVGLGNPEDGVLAFDAATGRRLWQTSFYADAGQDLDVGATPVVLGAGVREAVAIGSVGGLFKLLDATTGDTIWSSQLVAGSAVHGLIASPAYDGTDLFVPSASPPQGLFAVRAVDGAVVWMHPTREAVYSAPALGDHVVVFGEGNVFGDTALGLLVALDSASGRGLWSHEMGSAVRSGPVIAGDLVVAGDAAGEVVAFRPRS